MYNTVYMYYVKLLNKNVAEVISLIKRMLNVLVIKCLYTLRWSLIAFQSVLWQIVFS